MKDWTVKSTSALSGRPDWTRFERLGLRASVKDPLPSSPARTPKELRSWCGDSRGVELMSQRISIPRHDQSGTASPDCQSGLPRVPARGG